MDVTGLANHPTLSSGDDADQYVCHPRRLRARAARYRRLADILCDQQIISIVLACADEFEKRADLLSDAQNIYPESLRD